MRMVLCVAASCAALAGASPPAIDHVLTPEVEPVFAKMARRVNDEGALGEGVSVEDVSIEPRRVVLTFRVPAGQHAASTARVVLVRPEHPDAGWFEPRAEGLPVHGLQQLLGRLPELTRSCFGADPWVEVELAPRTVLLVPDP